ncbi:DUF58 domain-containing protein [Parahaliea aestuarii]|uniref:DUF58 domain-containing protein n=1 Tax=Parahaliea aestuarii TaxID=1852021 RepID=A0A5C8ZTD9_9GAMM|nr:DUF58 domain-containing protein [Parahaliea aestuarii]TXS91049.1 DUF58 domain-containing protein [Parahaliea aestuarii]
MSYAPEQASVANPQGWRARLRGRFQRWVKRRIPPSRSVTLDQKRIFIMPSRVGFFFLLCLAVMLLTAINYENNMSYGLTFLLATLFIVAILHTYANLAGLGVHAVLARAAFPGQQTEFDLRLERGGKRPRFDLRLRWPESSEQRINLADSASEVLRFYLPVGRRGWYHPGRLLIETTYPLGLLRCWTWVDLDLCAVVYPQPLASPELPGQAALAGDGGALPMPGSEDFDGFRDYRGGDSLRHVHWKGLARGQSLQSKLYVAHAERDRWLEWEAFAGLPVEQRLSHLCYWALDFDRRREAFGLRLPGTEIRPDSGDTHRELVLTALALHGVERPA